MFGLPAISALQAAAYAGVETELAFHLRESLPSALSGESLKNPGFFLGMMTSYAKYVQGTPTEGQRIDHLLKAPRSTWYGGNDPYQVQEQVSGVNRHFAFWGAMMTPVSWDMLELTKNTGITSGEFLDPNFSLSRMGETDRYSFYNQVETHYRQAIYGAGLDVERSIWGLWEPSDAQDKAPEDLKKIMNPDGDLHGIGPKVLGKFDTRHPLGRSGTKFPNWEYVHKPRVYYFDSTKGDGSGSADGTGRNGTKFQFTRDNIFVAIDEFLRPWDLIVRGPKVMPMNHKVFGLLATHKDALAYKGFARVSNGMGWEETVQVVIMHNTMMFSEPNAPEDELWGLHVGSAGGMDGTFYPVFWESSGNRKGRTQIDALQRKSNATPPAPVARGMTARVIPYYHDENYRFTERADSGGSHIRLMYMWICSERWCQTVGRGFTT